MQPYLLQAHFSTLFMLTWTCGYGEILNTAQAEELLKI